jgi:hypothetical protein
MESLTIAIQEAMKINNLSLFDLDDYSSDRSIGDYDWENSELDRMYEQPPPKVKPPPPDTNAILKICQWFRGQPNGGIIDLPDVREQIENLLPNLQPPILREHFKSLLPNLENPEHLKNRGHLINLPPIPDNRGQPHKSWLATEIPAGKSVDNKPLPAGTGNSDSLQTGSPYMEVRQERGQQNRGHPDYLPPILEPPKSLPPILDLQDRENRGQQETDPEQSQLLVTVGDRQIINGVAYILTHTKSPKPIFQTNGWLEVKQSANQRNLYLCLRWRAEGKKRSHHLGKVIRADAA